METPIKRAEVDDNVAFVRLKYNDVQFVFQWSKIKEINGQTADFYCIFIIKENTNGDLFHLLNVISILYTFAYCIYFVKPQFFYTVFYIVVLR